MMRPVSPVNATFAEVPTVIVVSPPTRPFSSELVLILIDSAILSLVDGTTACCSSIRIHSAASSFSNVLANSWIARSGSARKFASISLTVTGNLFLK